MTHRSRTLSRRCFCLCCRRLRRSRRNGAWLTPRQSFAKRAGIVEMIKCDGGEGPITVHQLRGNIAVLEGSGGNIAVRGAATARCSSMPASPFRARRSPALATLGPEPVTHLINTHWHFDHADGNAWLHDSAPTILATRTRAGTSRPRSASRTGATTSCRFRNAALPTEVFATEHRLTLDGTTHRHCATTGPPTRTANLGHFEEPDVLHVADTYWNGVYPFIDYSTGGGIDGCIRAAEANLAQARPTRRSSSPATARPSATAPGCSGSAKCSSRCGTRSPR